MVLAQSSIQIDRKNVPIPSECIFESVQKQILELNNREYTPWGHVMA